MINRSPEHSSTLSAPHSKPSVIWTLYLLFTIALVGLPGCTICAPFMLLGRFNRSLELFVGRVACRAIRFMFALNIWLKRDVRLQIPYDIGRTNRRCLFVANHRSNLDVFFLISYIPNIRVVAKSALFLVPFLGPMMWVMRQIAIKRGRFVSFFSVIDAIKDGLNNGDPILIFPEGQRCSKGFYGTQGFQPPVFQMAFDSKEPITPIVFVNTDLVWPKGSFAIDPSAKVYVVSLATIDPTNFASAHDFMLTIKRNIDACLGQYR